MNDTQKKTLAYFGKIAADYKLDADIDAGYANTGTVYFRDGFQSKLTVTYDFQSASASFFIGGQGTQYVKYNDGGMFNVLFSKIRTALDAAAKSSRGGK